MSLHIDFKNQRIQWIILAVLLIAMALIAYVNFLLKPTIAALSRINPELADLRMSVEETERWIRIRPKQEGRLEELKTEVSKYAVISSAEDEIPLLLQELSKVAHKSDVEIIGIRPEEVDYDAHEGRGLLEEIPISITARCGYHRLGYFISKLENSDRVFVIRGIKVTGRPQTTESHDVSLAVSTFLLSEE